MTLPFLQTLQPAAHFHSRSPQTLDEETFALFRRDDRDWLLIAAQSTLQHGARFEGETQARGDVTLKICPTSHHNAQALRELFAFTAPQPIGLRTSFGAGDRLGLAAAAHLQAARQAGARGQVALTTLKALRAAGKSGAKEDAFVLILAQQSMREMARTQRTPAEVLDAATWGAFRENWQAPWGADADHLKTPADIRTMFEAGFTFFTIDPSEHVDIGADSYAPDELQARFEALPNADELRTTYENQRFDISGEAPFEVCFTPEILQRAAVKYARAVDHMKTMMIALSAAHSERRERHRKAKQELIAQRRADGGMPINETNLPAMEVRFGYPTFDIEMSVDETDSPTSVEEHFFIAHELKRRHLRLQSLAIRFVGEFQKGIDYIGDLAEFEAQLRHHFAIAQQLGPYKISIHSGSDKFSIFPIVARVCGPWIHEKTAGTWYLEALRVVARCEPSLFREICDFSRARFPTERATYHVTESLDDLPDFSTLADDQLESILDRNAGRQMLHVTFGSVLTDKKQNGDWHFRTRLYHLWRGEEELHFEIVAAHSLRHLQALGMVGTASRS